MPKRRLLLLRHAKAVPGGADLADFDRPLAGRGEKAAAQIGRHMTEHGLVPGLVLCSPACRTRQTWQIVSRYMPETRTLMPDSLYDFGNGDTLLAAIRSYGATVRCLLLVGHNPAIAALASALSGGGDTAGRREMASKFPTAGLAIISFSGNGWAATAAGSGRLDAFLRPRDLDEG